MTFSGRSERRIGRIGWFLVLLGSPAALAGAAPTRLTLTLAVPSSSPVTAVLSLQPQSSTPGVPAPDPVRLELPVPAERTVELAAGSVWLARAEAAGHWSAEQLFMAGEGKVLEIRLYPTGTVEAKLETRPGERAPRAATVRFAPAPRAAGSPPDPPTAAAEGTVECPLRDGLLSCALPAGRLDLKLRAERHVPVYLWGVRLEPGRTLDLGPHVLRPGASVVGRVETADGTPVEGCEVELAPAGLGQADAGMTPGRLRAVASQTKTNERGFFQFEGVSPGNVTIVARRADFAPFTLSPILVLEGLETEIRDALLLGRPVRLTVSLAPALDPYGQPWRVQLLHLMEEGGASQVTEALPASSEGAWSRANLPPGTYRLIVFGDLDSRWVDQRAELLSAETHVPIQIPVVEVEGRVSLGDEPLAATLWLGGKSGARRVRFDADAEGLFAGFLPQEGTWPAELVSEAEGLRLALDPLEVAVPSGKRLARLDIRVPDTTLAGEVVDENGRRVPRARITLSGSKKTAETWSDDDGEFRIRGFGPPYAFVEATDGNRSSGPVQAALQEGKEGARLRLVVREMLELHGQVLSQQGPVPGAEVVAWPAMDQVPFAASASSVTGVSGEFDFQFPSETRSVTVLVLAPGYPVHMSQLAVERDRPVKVPLESDGGTLVVELPPAAPGSSGPAGLLVHNGAFAPLALLTSLTKRRGAVRVDSTGVVLTGMESGNYSLCRGSVQELRQGQIPAARCASGFLPPGGTLTLARPSG